jgi:hypothetical protein
MKKICASKSFLSLFEGESEIENEIMKIKFSFSSFNEYRNIEL